MRDIFSVVSHLPPTSIGLILQYPGELLKFATMVDRLRLTPDEARALAQIRPDQWERLIRGVDSEPALRRLVTAAPRTHDLRAAAEQPEVKSAIRRQLELAGIIVGGVLGILAALVSFLIAFAVFIGAVVAVGATLGPVVLAMFGVVAAGLALAGAGVGVIALIVYFLPENDPRARAVGTAIFGGVGGDAFVDDVALAQRIARISIRHGAAIDALQLTWQLGDGSFRAGPRRGGGGGSESIVDLEADEYITKVTGRSGAMIDALSIHTSKGRSFGPFGGDGGAPFTLEPDLGDRILGFHGRAGARLDALGVCSPAYGSGMHGGTGGDPFLDTVPPGGRLNEIVVRHGIYVDSIQVQWVDAENLVHVGERHGGDGGERRTIVKLADDEWISRVSGRAGVLLDRLELMTNKGNRHEFGDRGGNLFNIDVEPGERIVGFFGRAGRYIDAIGVCVDQVARKPLVFGARIALQSNHGPFLGVHDGSVGATRSDIGAGELFRIVAVDGQADGAPLHLGATVALLAGSGKYLSTHAAPEVRLADAIGDAGRFTLVHPISPTSTAGLAAGEVVALRSKRGQFVQTSAQRVVHVDADSPGADGTWLIHPQPI